MNEIRERARELEAFAELLQELQNRERWYMTEDEETGELIDDDSDYARANLKAIRATMKAIYKLAGV